MSPSETVASKPASPKIRVLLADDHPMNRTVVELILEVVGAEVVSVEDGAQAVEKFKLQPFDVVLMDIQMPVMDGLTAIRQIREYEAAHRERRTPVHVVSTNSLPEHLDQSMQAGADSHITKPIAAPVLLSAVMASREDGLHA